MITRYNSSPLEIIIRTDNEKIIFEQILETNVKLIYTDDFIDFQDQVNQGFSTILTDFYDSHSQHYQKLTRFFNECSRVSDRLLNNFTALNRLFNNKTSFKQIKFYIRGNISIPFDLLFKIPKRLSKEKSILDLLNSNEIIQFLFGYRFYVSYQINSKVINNKSSLMEKTELLLDMKKFKQVYTGDKTLSNYQDEYDSIKKHFPIIKMTRINSDGLFPNNVYQNHLLHISAHNENGKITITDENDSTQYIYVRNLVPVNKSFPITFLNICSGNNSFSIIENSIAYTLLLNNDSNCIISNCFAVPNSIAKDFSNEFYMYLSNMTTKFNLEDVINLLRKKHTSEVKPYLYAYNIWNNETKITLEGAKIGK